MTGPTDITEATHQPQILIDEWQDGWVESTAWVEVTSEVTDPATAVAWIEKFYPVEDREEEEGYACEGETVWQKPDVAYLDFHMDHGDGEIPWIKAEREDDKALQFWVVKVVCAA